MQVLSVTDLNHSEATHALLRLRRDANKPSVSQDTIDDVVSIVGGRLSYLNRVARAKDMKGMAKHMLDVEKGWILSQIGTSLVTTVSCKP